MKKLIPCFYSSYGRYISKLRMIPSNIDALQPVLRRCLLGLHETANTSKSVKSAKVVGMIIGNYHPHGDVSCYNTLHQLVINRMAIGGGNWGGVGLTSDSPASMRYTGIKIAKWIDDLAFKYIDHVKWDNIEYENEPMYLPSPVPVGLIGNGVLSGIAFHKSVMPRYTLKDLLNRTKDLLEHDGDSLKLSDNHLIYPLINGCLVRKTQDNIDGAKSLLVNGEASIEFTPTGKIVNDTIEITGKSPGRPFTSLIKACSDKTSILNGMRVVDVGSKNGFDYNIHCIPRKKTPIKEIFSEIWETHLISSFNFKCYFSNDKGEVVLHGLDDIIKTNYIMWSEAVLNKKIMDYRTSVTLLLNNTIVNNIRLILEHDNSTTVDDLILQFFGASDSISIQLPKYENSEFSSYDHIVTTKYVRTLVTTSSIKKLIEGKTDTQCILQTIEDNRQNILNNDLDCYNTLCDLAKS